VRGTGFTARPSAELDIKQRRTPQAMASRQRCTTRTCSRRQPGWKLWRERRLRSSVESAQQNLEASPPHLANMLNPAFNQVGVGVRTVNGTTYVVQVFAGR
jgi:hypothetical protein